MYQNDLHIAMYNRQEELKYLKCLVLNLLPLITPHFIYECKGSCHFLCELFACRILIDGIDSICLPNTLNRLFYLYFTNAIQRQETNVEPKSVNEYIEILSRFCSVNGKLHKNKLVLHLNDVMHDKELLNQFSRVLYRHGSIDLLSIYLTLTDILNDIPSASDISVRKKIYERLKHIDERYLKRFDSKNYITINNPYDKDTVVDQMKDLIYIDLERSINNKNDNQSNISNESFDIKKAFTILSRLHCEIYELIEEKYQRNFLTSDEHFHCICGRRMDSFGYRIMEEK